MRLWYDLNVIEFDILVVNWEAIDGAVCFQFEFQFRYEHFRKLYRYFLCVFVSSNY